MPPTAETPQQVIGHAPPESGIKQPGPRTTPTKWLQSARNDDLVVIWELDTEHPEGEVFIAGKVPVEAALTPDVNMHLRNGELKEASAAAVEKRKKQIAATQTAAKPGDWD